ncbi:MAG: hypothetical protein IPN69_23780 [Acidobacteria bacterium]|nr:hypothetical protein [Acidobacteriota bacterium]MBK8813731.1 hypothetical protein [Acidobacteriota bacterium]
MKSTVASLVLILFFFLADATAQTAAQTNVDRFIKSEMEQQKETDAAPGGSCVSLPMPVCRFNR